jgi:hypothetical protein
MTSSEPRFYASKCLSHNRPIMWCIGLSHFHYKLLFTVKRHVLEEGKNTNDR